MEFNNLSMEELFIMRDDIDLEIKVRQEQELASAREKIVEIAKSMGMSVDQILGKPAADKGPGKVRGTVAVKFRHPSNPSLQWTGRGRKPQWIVDYIKDKPIEDLAV